MSVYPLAIDSDATIPRIDDNLSEIGTDVINSIRSAIFAIETEMGLVPKGSLGSLADRLNISLNANGTIKASALTAVGLVTLPITDFQIGVNAGIKEYKLALDHKTADLFTLISSNTVLLNSVNAFLGIVSTDFTNHLSGAKFLSNGVTSARHVASHIDLNNVPTDIRDPFFSWSGLLDKTGIARTAKTVGDALLQINNDLTTHENAIVNAHVATSIIVDSDEFIEIPTTANTVQKVIDYLDDAEVLNIGQHRATQHANCIPKTARSNSLTLPDGYGVNVVPVTSAITYLIHSPNVAPVDDLSIGDDLIKFVPDNSNFVFDAKFNQVKIGDIAVVNYDNGIEVSFMVESIRYVPGSEWIIRINGLNLFDTSSAQVRIDRAPFDDDTVGILAVAAANGIPTSSFSNILSGVIIGHPRAASALGLEFDPGQLDSNHYFLWLEMYPTGNPVDHVISLPGIDVTGNLGITPGKYTLDSVVQATNNSFRKIGYNFRFIAFSKDGEFGVMLADEYNGVGFAIVNGINSSGSIATGLFINNVVGGNAVDDFDALGFGVSKTNIASPSYQGTFADTTSAQIPTKILTPRKHRNYIVNGQKHDLFASTYLANSSGYWDGYISARNPVATFTIETTYVIRLNLQPSGLKAGKTIVIQPKVDFTDPLYSDVDYGRFIIKNVNFIAACGGGSDETQITVINSIHGTGNGFGFSSSPSLPVKIYFSFDSVGFNDEEIIDTTPSVLDYHRLHEIYIDASGKTFSHERARLPLQTEDSTSGFLGTIRWHIQGVSSKLRGYHTISPLIFNKFIRLYILSYDATSGEFDGYLGERVSSTTSNVLRTGRVVTGRKNVVTRFYDETNVDYLDLIFVDDSSPGTNILSDTTPRFVDIELFPSLINDDEVMILATCEVNWNASSGQDIVERVIDARQYGSIDETNFTNSAMDFISAGDKWLHENGIIQGFDYDSINTSDNREIYYKGGIAVVNGKIVTVNNSPVTIPQIYKFGTSLPQNIIWAICVNTHNDLVPIIITSTKTQFFATTNGVSSFYIPSVTFTELIQTRKDLCPISLVTAHIASFTITPSVDILDVRRFVNGSIETPLILNSNETTGNFHDFTAIKNWIINFNSTGNIIYVKGTFNLSASLDLTGFTQPVVFEGQGATITINTSKGFIIGNNVTLRNLNFIYNPPTITYTTGDLVNSGNGCIFADARTVNLSTIQIDRCSFNETVAGSQRPSYINFVLERTFSLSDIVISNNNFTDSGSTINNAAIAIINVNSLGAGVPASVNNLFIENNKCNSTQGIYVTSTSTSTGQAGRGLNSYNSYIRSNSCGVIGIFTSGTSNASYLTTNLMIVEKNRCMFIASLDAIGRHVKNFISILYGTGNLIVRDNACHWIHLSPQDHVATNEYSITKIINNTLTGYETGFTHTFLDTYYISTNTSIVNTAIIIYNANLNTENNVILIDGNHINFGYYTTIRGYINGIECSASAIITNNIIKGILDNGSDTSTHGILLLNATGCGVATDRTYLVKGNQIYRGANNITGYVFVFASTVNDVGQIVENSFDSPYIDVAATDTTTVTAPSTGFIIERNINQTVVAYIFPLSGFTVINNNVWNASIPSTVFIQAVPGTAVTATTLMTFGIALDATTESFTWTTYFSSIPRNTYIINISVPIRNDPTLAPDQTSTALLTLQKASGSVTSSTLNLVTTAANVTTTLTATSGDKTYRIDGTLLAKVNVILKASDASFSNRVIAMEALVVTYRW